MKKWILLLVMALVLTIGAGIARAESSVQLFVVICDNQAVVNFNGSMDAGFDLFYQVFAGPGGTGAALTNIRRIQVDGTYAVSEVVPYINSQTVAAGGTASARVTIASESSGGSGGTAYTADDINDGCNNPTNPTVSSVDTGAGGTSTVTGGSTILSPFGGVINPGQAAATPEPLVVIGARSVPATQGRSATPGVIFAECDQYLPGAAPGIIYNTDNITIFWSWYAKTQQQVEDYIAQAIHEVSLNRAPLVNVQVSEITRPNNRNYWVFYTASIGNLAPGSYGVEFKLSWKQQISDGYSTYGPEGDTERVNSTCTFRVDSNPNGGAASYNGMYSVR